MNEDWLLAAGGVVLAIAVIYIGGKNDRQWRRSRAHVHSDGTVVRGDVKWRGATSDGYEVLVLLRNDEEQPPSTVTGGVNLRTPFEYQWVITIAGHVYEEVPVASGADRDSMIQRASQLIAMRDARSTRRSGDTANRHTSNKKKDRPTE